MKPKVQSPKSKVAAACSSTLLALAFIASDLVGLADVGPPVPVEDMAQRADAIVHGKVASLECTRDGGGHMFMRVELDVAEMWKGAATNRFALVTAGGLLGDRKVTVIGQAEYRLGEEVVVFAARNPRGEAVTLNLAQGKFTVAEEAAKGMKRVSNGVLGGPEPKAGYRLPTQVPLEFAELRRRVEGSK